MAESEVKNGKRGRKAALKAAREGQDEAATVQPPSAPAKKGPRKDGVPKNITFFQRVASFPKEDWGSRVRVKVYRLAPIINQLLGSEHKYAKLYISYPGPDEEQIKNDCGSGRYRLYLNYKAPADSEKEIDSVEIDILDMKFPPVIPKGAWLDDPRNKDWEWARKFYEEQEKQQQQSRSSGNTADAVLDAIEIVDKLKGNQPSALDTIRLVKELTPAPARSATDELQTLVTVAEKLRPPETVPQFMQAQFASLQAQINSAQESRDKLMMMLLEKKNGGDQNGFSVVKELFGGLKELMPEVKTFFPGLGEDGGGRSRMGGWQEFTVAMAPHISPILAPFAQMFAQLFVLRMQGQPQPGMPPQPQSGQPPASHQPNPGLPAGPPATMMPFLQMIANPMMNFARDLADPTVTPQDAGEALAEWVHNGFGESPQYEQAIIASRAMGPVGIIAAFRSVPQVWADKGPRMDLPSLAELEPKLPAFFDAFLKWIPDQDRDSDEEPGETDPAVPEVLTYHEGAEAGY